MSKCKDQKVAEKRDALAVQMRGFLLCYKVSRSIPSGTGSKHGSSAASMTGKNDDYIGGKLCSDKLLVVSDGLRLHRKTGRKRENKWSLTNKTYFQCSEADDAADADMNAVAMVGAD